LSDDITGLFSVVKVAACAEVNNACRYTSSLPYVLMACYLAKHKNNFNLFILYIGVFVFIDKTETN